MAGPIVTPRAMVLATATAQKNVEVNQIATTNRDTVCASGFVIWKVLPQTVTALQRRCVGGLAWAESPL